MWWKIYSWLFLLVNLYSTAVLLTTYRIDLFVILSILLSLGLNIVAFSFAYKKSLSNSFVRTIFWFNIIFLLMNILYQSNSQFQNFLGPVEKASFDDFINILFSYLPSIPAILSAYKLGYKSN